MEKFGWIGGIDLGPVVVAVKKDLPYRNIDDLRNANKSIFFAGSVSGSTSNAYPLILKKYGGLNLKVISGYRGLSAAFAAINEARLKRARDRYLPFGETRMPSGSSSDLIGLAVRSLISSSIARSSNQRKAVDL